MWAKQALSDLDTDTDKYTTDTRQIHRYCKLLRYQANWGKFLDRNSEARQSNCALSPLYIFKTIKDIKAAIDMSFNHFNEDYGAKEQS